MKSFKPGDKVKCLIKRPEHFLDVGSTLMVFDVGDDVFVACNGQYNAARNFPLDYKTLYYNKDFELINKLPINYRDNNKERT